MENDFIVNENKYLVGTRAIGLSLNLKNLPKEINLLGHKLLLKSSFHVTLVAYGEIARKHSLSIPDFDKNILEDFKNFLKNKDVSFLNFNDEFRLVTKGERISLISMCNISNLEEFFALINKKYGLNVEIPPTHVTLYTLQPDKGIFLTDSSDLKNLTEIISRPPGINLYVN